MDPSWGGGLKGSPSAKEGMSPAALLPVAGLGLAAKAGPAVMRGGQAVVAGADKVSDFVVELMRVYKTLPPDKKNLAWRIIQEVIAKEAIEGSVDSPDKSVAKQGEVVDSEEVREYDPTGRLTGHAAFLNQQDIRGHGFYSPIEREVVKYDDKKPAREWEGLVRKGGGGRALQISDYYVSPLDRKKSYTGNEWLANVEEPVIEKNIHNVKEKLFWAMDEHEEELLSGEGTGSWDNEGHRTIFFDPNDKGLRNNVRSYLHVSPGNRGDGTLQYGGYVPEHVANPDLHGGEIISLKSDPSDPDDHGYRLGTGAAHQAKRGWARDYEETLFQRGLSKYITESAEFQQYKADNPRRLIGKKLKEMFPNHIFWDESSELHWPGDYNVIAHSRTDVRSLNGVDTLWLEEAQADWSAGHRKKINALRILKSAVQDPDGFFNEVFNAEGDTLVENKSLNELFDILEKTYDVFYPRHENSLFNVLDIIKNGSDLVGRMDFTNTDTTSPELIKIREALVERLDAVSMAREGFLDESVSHSIYNEMVTGDTEEQAGQLVKQVEQAIEDSPISPYDKVEDWTLLVAKDTLLKAAEKDLFQVAWPTGELKNLTLNPGLSVEQVRNNHENIESKLFITQDKPGLVRAYKTALKQLGYRGTIDISRVPVSVIVPISGGQHEWPVRESFVWELKLNKEIIDLIKNKGFKTSLLDDKRGGLLGQERKRELYA
jgi:hypothetical protein